MARGQLAEWMGYDMMNDCELGLFWLHHVLNLREL